MVSKVLDWIVHVTSSANENKTFGVQNKLSHMKPMIFNMKTNVLYLLILFELNCNYLLVSRFPSSSLEHSSNHQMFLIQNTDLKDPH